MFFESKPDDAPFLEVEAPKNIIPLVDVKVKGDISYCGDPQITRQNIKVQGE